MSSIRRVMSSRRNGARSRGPKTAEGKQRSARNATRHGLLARCVVLENESEEAFRKVIAEHVDCFDTPGGVGFGMIEEMASAYWRLRRLWAVETRLYNDAMAAEQSDDELARIAGAFKALAESPQFSVLHRYESRLHRMYQRAFHNSFLLREMNLPNEPSPISGHGRTNNHPGPSRRLAAAALLPAPSPDPAAPQDAAPAPDPRSLTPDPESLTPDPGSPTPDPPIPHPWRP